MQLATKLWARLAGKLATCATCVQPVQHTTTTWLSALWYVDSFVIERRT